MCIRDSGRPTGATPASAASLAPLSPTVPSLPPSLPPSALDCPLNTWAAQPMRAVTHAVLERW
eukprot:2044485-Rhodomonas_salina.2